MEPSDMNTFSQLLHTLLGIGTEPRELTFLQVSVRGVIVFIATLIMVRLSSKRSLAEKTASMLFFVVIIGSMLARAINGSEAFFSDAGHWIRSGVAASAFRYRRVLFHMLLESWLREDQWYSCRAAGCSRKLLWEHISKHDLEEDMRLDATTEDLSKYKLRCSNAAETSALIKANSAKQQAT